MCHGRGHEEGESWQGLSMHRQTPHPLCTKQEGGGGANRQPEGSNLKAAQHSTAQLRIKSKSYTQRQTASS